MLLFQMEGDSTHVGDFLVEQKHRTKHTWSIIINGFLVMLRMVLPAT